LNDAADRLRNHIDKQNTIQANAQAVPVQNNPSTRSVSYAATAQSHIPLAHANAIGRHSERSRQVIIQPALDAIDSFRGLTELELIAKASLAFEAIPQSEPPAPPDFRFVGAKKLAKGSLILDMNSESAANWLKSSGVRQSFMQHFSAVSVLKEHEFRVLAEFVPVTFDPDALAALERIEKDSGAPPGGLVRAEWAKLPERRHPMQRIAHLKLFFNTAETANYAIRNGLYIAGKKVGIRKMNQEARRCAKCQRYGHGNNEGSSHFAKDCKWVHDTCGGCGQHHRKEECMTDLSINSYCVNCDVKGHTVWDRNCPTFIDRCKSLNAANKDSNYLLFVTRDASTWETIDSDRKSQTQGKMTGHRCRGEVRVVEEVDNSISGPHLCHCL
jgi:hypothetical protein